VARHISFRVLLAAAAIVAGGGLASRALADSSAAAVKLDGASAATLVGVADWRGQDFDGRITAAGDRFDMFRLTAASASLPLNSYAAVTNLKTGESVMVRINDRPAAGSAAVITLSFAAAHRLGVDVEAPAQVKVAALKSGPLMPAPAPGAMAGAERPRWFPQLRLAQMGEGLGDSLVDDAGERGLRRILHAGAHQDLMVTWVEDLPDPMAGL
jgi:hypothetical protein